MIQNVSWYDTFYTIQTDRAIIRTKGLKQDVMMWT